MGRHVVSLVTLAMLAAAGCLPELPRELRIEGRFTDEEVAVLLGAIDEANARLGEPLLGHPVLAYAGRFDDADGFRVDDFGDDVHAIYPLDPDSPEYAFIRRATGFEVAGYATLSDVLIVRWPRDGDGGGSSDGFRLVALHELGHFLGMAHNPDPDTVMHLGPFKPGVTTYTLGDQQAFCMDYPCVHPPP